MYPQSMFSKNKKNMIFFPVKIFYFYNQKNFCILHGGVSVMISENTKPPIF